MLVDVVDVVEDDDDASGDVVGRVYVGRALVLVNPTPGENPVVLLYVGSPPLLAALPNPSAGCC